MKIEIIRAKKTLELQEHEEKLRGQLFALNFQKQIGKLDTPHMISQIKKDISRIQTELTARKATGETIKSLNIIKMEMPEVEPKDSKKTKEEKKVLKLAKKEAKTTTKQNTELDQLTEKTTEENLEVDQKIEQEKETNKKDTEIQDPSKKEDKKITTEDSTPKEEDNNDK